MATDWSTHNRRLSLILLNNPRARPAYHMRPCYHSPIDTAKLFSTHTLLYTRHPEDGIAITAEPRSLIVRAVSYSVLTYWVLAGIRQEDLLKVRTANSEDYFMGIQQFAIAGQGHVDQITTLI